MSIKLDTQTWQKIFEAYNAPLPLYDNLMAIQTKPAPKPHRLVGMRFIAAECIWQTTEVTKTHVFISALSGPNAGAPGRGIAFPYQERWNSWPKQMVANDMREIVQKWSEQQQREDADRVRGMRTPKGFLSGEAFPQLPTDAEVQAAKYKALLGALEGFQAGTLTLPSPPLSGIPLDDIEDLSKALVTLEQQAEEMRNEAKRKAAIAAKEIWGKLLYGEAEPFSVEGVLCSVRMVGPTPGTIKTFNVSVVGYPQTQVFQYEWSEDDLLNYFWRRARNAALECIQARSREEQAERKRVRDEAIKREEGVRDRYNKLPTEVKRQVSLKQFAILSTAVDLVPPKPEVPVQRDRAIANPNEEL